MYDALLLYQTTGAKRIESVCERLGVGPREFYLVTVHRTANTESGDNLRRILLALQQVDRVAVFPVHPRTRLAITDHKVNLAGLSNIRFIEPLAYFDMLALIQSARKVITDSGGVQKEAYCLNIPCITLRSETEWVETLAGGWNTLVGAETSAILHAILQPPPSDPTLRHYGDGRASWAIASILDREAW
jgi:UDP-N-acetylglucosamine 2-epimerase